VTSDGFAPPDLIGTHARRPALDDSTLKLPNAAPSSLGLGISNGGPCDHPRMVRIPLSYTPSNGITKPPPFTRRHD